MELASPIKWWLYGTMKSLDKSGDNSPLGKNWVGRFVRRHEEVKNAISRPIPIDRFLAMEDESIQHYFDRYEEVKRGIRLLYKIYGIWMKKGSQLAKFRMAQSSQRPTMSTPLKQCLESRLGVNYRVYLYGRHLY